MDGAKTAIVRRLLGGIPSDARETGEASTGKVVGLASGVEILQRCSAALAAMVMTGVLNCAWGGCAGLCVSNAGCSVCLGSHAGFCWTPLPMRG